MNPIASFIAGIIGAFAPCVVVLIPLVVYRFFNKEEKQTKYFFIFILGFLMTYTLLAISIQKMFTSGMQNGFKLGFGFIFIAIGILALMRKINPLKLPYVKNSFLLGIFYALLISANPCTLPYLSLIIALNNTGLIFLNLLAFGFGLLVPSLLFAVFGSSVMRFATKHGKILNATEYVINSLLILAGVYLIITIKAFGKADVIVAVIMLVILFLLLMSTLREKKELFNLPAILLLISLLLIIVTAFFYCNSYVQHAVSGELAQCSLKAFSCHTCNTCISIFSLAVLFGIAGIVIERFLNKL